jgi:GntR family transcriptional repressor for pyruvate dehydrogenase complex
VSECPEIAERKNLQKNHRARRPRPARSALPSTADKSATREVADALRREILCRSESDSFIGLEEELIARFKVSKPTFRQAAKMLEHEQILLIKRGARGGFFARPPTEKMVSHMAAMVLAARGATLRQIAAVAGPLTVEAVRELADNPSPSVRARVAAFVEEHAGFEKLAVAERSRVIANFERLIAHLSGNPALALFSEAIQALVREPVFSTFRVTQAQAAEVADCYRSLAALIAKGESEMAVILARRYALMVIEWLPEDTPVSTIT